MYANCGNCGAELEKKGGKVIGRDRVVANLGHWHCFHELSLCNRARTAVRWLHNTHNILFPRPQSCIRYVRQHFIIIASLLYFDIVAATRSSCHRAAAFSRVRSIRDDDDVSRRRREMNAGCASTKNVCQHNTYHTYTYAHNRDRPAGWTISDETIANSRLRNTRLE